MTTAGAKRVLMIAFHFPPLAGSSGIQRTLRFVQHLPALGWQPIVLSANPRAYERTSDDLSAEVPASVVVRRAFALDTARHLAIRGRYPGRLALPDRWMTWRWDAVRQGLRLVRQHRPQAIWSTYPIATAHAIGAELQRRTRLPWLADFRDPMAQPGYPSDPRAWQRYSEIEQRAATQARLMSFTTPSAAQAYRVRYPQAAERIVVLENGFDEPSFAAAERAAGGSARAPLAAGRLTLLHSGIVYPSERDPTQLFEALAALKADAPALAARLCIRFRAAVHDELLQALGSRHGVGDLIEVLPALPYAQALAEMLRADGLLLLQAGNCNEQIPAKLYEYLRARRPILCLSDPPGDTWAVLRAAGVERMARLNDAGEIAGLIRHFADHGGDGLLPRDASVAAASRAAGARRLAGWLDQMAGDRSPGAGPLA